EGRGRSPGSRGAEGDGRRRRDARGRERGRPHRAGVAGQAADGCGERLLKRLVNAGLCVAALLISTAAYAQPSPPPASSPGPYVIDVRGVMSGAPGGTGFYPVVASTTIVPKRAFGLGIGAHLYPFRLGVARLGLGVEAMRSRGTAVTPVATTTTSTTSTSATTTSGTSANAAEAVMDLTTV